MDFITKLVNIERYFDVLRRLDGTTQQKGPGIRPLTV